MAREIQFDPEAPGMGLFLGTSSTDYTFPPRSGVELMGVVTEDNINPNTDPDSNYLDDYLRMFAKELSHRTVDEFLLRFGGKAINYRDASGKNVLHHAILQRRFSLAKRIFEFAKENGVLVDVCWKDGDILKWAIDQESWECVDFVLKKLTSKCASVQQTGELLKLHFKRLITDYPLLIEEYLAHDRFCFEFGRFKVPSRIFNHRRLIAMTTADPCGWEGTSAEVEDFWRKNSEVLSGFDNDDNRRSVQTTAIAKFACIEDIAYRGSKKSIPSQLLVSRASVDVFKSNLIWLLVQWKWREFWKKRYLIAFWLHVVSAVAFVLFAANFGFGTNELDDESGGRLPETWDLYTSSPTNVARVALSISLVVGLSSIPLRVIPPPKILSFFIHLILWSHSLGKTEHTDLTLFLTSFECVSTAISLVWFFQAFRSTGPLTSMVWYSLLDARIFLAFGIIVMAGFAEAMHVLHGNKFSGDDSLRYVSPQRSFESMGYAVLGEFEPHDYRSNSTPMFVYSWRKALFDSFLFLGPILMLSLLVSILGDTYDRVRLNEKAEQIKARARVIHVSERMNRYIQMVLPAFEERFKRTKATRAHEPSTISKRVLQAYSGLAGEREMEGKYFHFLVPAERPVRTKDSTWKGKLVANEKMINRAIEETETKAKKDKREFKQEMDGLKEEVKNLIAEQNTKINQQAARHELMLAMILQKLDEGA